MNTRTSLPTRHPPAALLRTLFFATAASIMLALFVGIASAIEPRPMNHWSLLEPWRFHSLAPPPPEPRIIWDFPPQAMSLPYPYYRIKIGRIEPLPAGALRDQLHSVEVRTSVFGPLALRQDFLCFRMAGSEPEYPASARRRGIEGQVVIDVATDATGAVSDASVLQSEPAGVFDAAALRAVRRWRYPVSGCERTQVRLRFELP